MPGWAQAVERGSLHVCSATSRCTAAPIAPTDPLAAPPPPAPGRSTLNGRSVPPRFRGSGKTVYRHSLRVWNLPDFSPAGEFITGEAP